MSKKNAKKLTAPPMSTPITVASLLLGPPSDWILFAVSKEFRRLYREFFIIRL